MRSLLSQSLLPVTVLMFMAAQLTGQNDVRPAVPGTDNLALIDNVEEEFESLFNGKTLDGWEQKNGTATYEVVDNTILGRTAVGSPNSFLCTVREYGDFDLRFEVKVDVGLNSGVQIRSVSRPGFKKGRVHGPQVEIETDPGEAGYIYSEGTGRGWISPTQTQRGVFKNDGWNSYRVLAEGNRIQTWINGTHIEDLETPPVEPVKGFIGLQVHGIKKKIGPFKVQWRNIRIRELDGTETRTVQAARGTPVIDGKIDDLWKNVPRILTDRMVDEGESLSDDDTPATAFVRCVWDDGHLYCLAEVRDSKVSTGGGDAWQRDSVEFFVDGNLSRGETYDEDDAQYRTDADGEESFGASSNSENYKSAVTRVNGGYIVESCITIKTGPGKRIGFDVQVNNDAGQGIRQSLMKWNDPTNDSYFNVSGFGVLEMVGGKK